MLCAALQWRLIHSLVGDRLLACHDRLLGIKVHHGIQRVVFNFNVALPTKEERFILET